MSSIAAISRMYCPHHVDHLAPFCDLLGAELLSAEEDHLIEAEKYPGVKSREVSFTDLHPSELAKKYTTVVHSFPWPKKMIELWLSLDPQKKLRALHTPHGHSDKGYYSGTLESYIYQDIVLLYGNRMIKMLEDLHLLDKIDSSVVIGNPRWHYYQKYRDHFDRLAAKEVSDHFDPAKKTILYAPTWYDFEKSSTFFESSHIVLEQLSDHYNILVKVHPLLKENDIAKLELFYIFSESKKNVAVIKDYHHIYSLLSLSDIYIGDLSSMGYDFLLFDRPMFFFNPQRKSCDRSLYLHHCGITLDPKNTLLPQIENGVHLDGDFSLKRKQLAKETFAKLSPAELKEALLRWI